MLRNRRPVLELLFLPYFSSSRDWQLYLILVQTYWNYVAMVVRDVHCSAYLLGCGTPCNQLARDASPRPYPLRLISRSTYSTKCLRSASLETECKMGIPVQVIYCGSISMRNGLGKLLHRVSPALRQGACISYAKAIPG